MATTTACTDDKEGCIPGDDVVSFNSNNMNKIIYRYINMQLCVSLKNINEKAFLPFLDSLPRAKRKILITQVCKKVKEQKLAPMLILYRCCYVEHGKPQKNMLVSWFRCLVSSCTFSHTYRHREMEKARHQGEQTRQHCSIVFFIPILFWE